MLMGALIGGLVGVALYFVKNAQDKKKAAENNSTIDAEVKEKE